MKFFERRDAELTPARGADDALRDGCDSPTGLPMASTMSPTRSPIRWPTGMTGTFDFRIELQHREVGVRIAADDLRVGDAPSASCARIRSAEAMTW
jgi:hypothetical protein